MLLDNHSQCELLERWAKISGTDGNGTIALDNTEDAPASRPGTNGGERYTIAAKIKEQVQKYQFILNLGPHNPFLH